MATEDQDVPEESAGPIEDAVLLDEPGEADASKPVETEPEEAAGKPEVLPEDEPAPYAQAEMEKAPKALRKSGVAPFIGFLLGGVVAAAIGFGAARYVVPEGWPFPGTTPEEDPIPGLVAAQGDDIAALKGTVGQLGEALSALENDTSLEDALTALTARADALSTEIGAATARLDEIEARLTAVEKLAPEGSAAAQAAAEAYDRELTALREMFAGELAKIEAAQSDVAALEAEAAESARAATGRAALARVMAALDTGQPFADALAELTGATGQEAPAGLADLAAEGVPTLAALQEAFPEAARAALDAAIRTAAEEGSMSRIEAFLRLQLGTRSLEPKEGVDPDAILSRAEDALRQGDIAGALADLDAMPGAAQPALAGWKAMAETRKAALDAAAALAQELNAK